MKLFSVYDAKAEAHVIWMTSENAETIQREIRQRMEGTQMDTFAEDYTLFEIAYIDETTGKLLPHDALRSVCNFLAMFPKHGMSDDGDQHKQLDIQSVK